MRDGRLLSSPTIKQRRLLAGASKIVGAPTTFIDSARGRRMTNEAHGAVSLLGAARQGSARRSHIIRAEFQHREMDACTIDEDFRRATRDARSNWAQVARSLENLKKSAKSNAKVQAQVTD